MDKIKHNKKKILITVAIVAGVGVAGYFGYKYFGVRPEVLEAADTAKDAVVELAKSGK